MPEFGPFSSGAITATGWKVFDPQRGIYVADVPVGTDARQLWVDGQLMHRGFHRDSRSAVEFTPDGIRLKDASYDYLERLPDQNRIEVESTGFFTDRISPVEKISGRMLTMKQPAWNNNIWGYDTLNSPHRPELSHLYLVNSLAFVTRPGNCSSILSTENCTFILPADRTLRGCKWNCRVSQC